LVVPVGDVAVKVVGVFMVDMILEAVVKLKVVSLANAVIWICQSGFFLGGFSCHI